MPEIELAGVSLEVNELGFMQETDKWNEDIALAFAAKDGVKELTADHWTVLKYLRDYYLRNGICPMLRRLKKDTGFNLAMLYTLFPEGSGKFACKWAGLPNAAGCS